MTPTYVGETRDRTDPMYMRDPETGALVRREDWEREQHLKRIYAFTAAAREASRKHREKYHDFQYDSWTSEYGLPHGH